MPDVSVGGLVAVERLAGADCRGPRLDTERIAHVRSKRVPAIPHVEDEDHDQCQKRPAHRRGFTITRIRRWLSSHAIKPHRKQNIA